MPKIIDDIKKEIPDFEKHLPPRIVANNKLKAWCFEQRPEYLFTLVLFVFMFALMGIACVFRLLGIGWFRVDYSGIVLPALWVQESVKFALFWFEYTFILEILTSKGFLKCTGMAFLCVGAFAVGSAVVGNFFSETLSAAVAVILPLNLLKNPTKLQAVRSIKASLMLIVTASTYGALMLFGRFLFNTNIKYDYVTNILSSIDYKLLFVNIYLAKKLREGVKR